MREAPPETGTKKINAMRHFDELDDLTSGKRDGELMESSEFAANYARELNRSLAYENFFAVMFVCSDKKRSTQTAESINEEIAKINPKVKTLLKVDSRLDSLDEGKIILPDGYTKGDHFPGFDIASRIFMEEAHGTDYGKTEDNITYKYGDPVKLATSEYKYPELTKYFSSPGESYSEYLFRTYSLILDSVEKSDKFGKKVKIVLVTHAQTFQLIKSLLTILDEIKAGKLNVDKGNLALLCWKDFLDRRKKKTAAAEWNVSSTNLLDIDQKTLNDPILLKILNQELEYLNKI